MAAHSAALRGAAQIFVVDKGADRLALAEKYGATAVNFVDADPADVITDAKARPSLVVSHELPLDRAPDAYARFDGREDGLTKVLLHPAA